MSAKPEQHLKVGDWWYLPQQDKLVKIDETGDISETASLDNLCQKALNYFLVNAGRLITRDELLSDVWGVRDVSDGRISRVIRVLRVALGDDSREPRYIETIPKRGFRFIAPVSEVILVADSAEADETTSQNELIAQQQSQNQHRHWWLLAAVFVSCMVAITGWHYWQQSLLEQHVPFGRFEPISSMDGLELYPDVSKDGSYLVYGHSPDFEGNSSLILQNTQTLEKKLLKTVNAGGLRGPIFSPDMTQIVYQHLLREHFCEIRIMTLNAATYDVVSDKLLTQCGLKSVGARMSWSPDGKYVVFPNWLARTESIVLQLQPIAGGPAEELTTPPQTSLGDFAARFSADGSKIVFVRDVAGGTGQIWLLDMETRSSKMLFQPEHNYPGNVAWTVDGKGIIYPSGTNSLSVYDLHTGVSTLFANTDSSPHDVLVSKDNRIFASIGRFWQSSIRKVNNRLENPVQSADEVEFAKRSEGIVQLNPNPDGPAAVLTSRSGGQQVWLYYPDGRQKQISSFTGQMYPKVLEFSPDGKKLLVLVNAMIWLLEDGKEPVAITTPEQQSREPSWGADSQTIYFKLSHNGRWQIMRQRITEKTASIFSDQWDFFQESPSGDYQLRHLPGESHIELIYKDSQDVIKLLNMPKFEFLSPRIILREHGVYFSTASGPDKVEIFRFNLKTLQIESTGVEQKYLGRRFDVSLDENFIYQDDGKRGDIDIAELKF